MSRHLTSGVVGSLAVAVALTLAAGSADACFGRGGCCGWYGCYAGWYGGWGCGNTGSGPAYCYGSNAYGCPRWTYAAANATTIANSCASTTPAPGTAATTKAVGYLRLRLPAAGAEVWANGVRMSQTGSVRDFATPPLAPGNNYYDVRVRWTEPAGEQEATRTVRVRPADTIVVDFTTAPPTEATAPVSVER